MLMTLMPLKRAVDEPCETADERMVVRVHAVTVQFLKIGEDFLDVVERVRPLRMARELSDLPRA